MTKCNLLYSIYSQGRGEQLRHGYQHVQTALTDFSPESESWALRGKSLTKNTERNDSLKPGLKSEHEEGGEQKKV